MKKNPLLSIAVFVCISSVASADSFGTGANQFEIDFVSMSGDTNPTSGYGIVNNDYRMGTYEITNDQWAKFQTAYGTVTGSPSEAYDTPPTYIGLTIPTNELSWYEAAQFVNWLNTSTGHSAAYKFTGTQGTSDYTLSVWDVTETDGTNLYRHKDAHYFLPTEDEWVKAAYWNGTNLQTYSNASPGDIVSGSPDPAKWNYTHSSRTAPWNVGSGSGELNGTFDMMGNVWEWMESPYISGEYLSGSARGIRGGSYNNRANALSSSDRLYDYPYGESSRLGFRVASVPEPCSLVLLGLGGLLMRKRHQ